MTEEFQNMQNSIFGCSGQWQQGIYGLDFLNCPFFNYENEWKKVLDIDVDMYIFLKYRWWQIIPEIFSIQIYEEHNF